MSNLNQLFDDRPCTWWSNGLFTITQENTRKEGIFFPKQLAKISWGGGAIIDSKSVANFQKKYNEALDMKKTLDNKFLLFVNKMNKTIITSKELFKQFAPTFNFEYNEEQLVKVALKRGFIKPTNTAGEYLINEDY